MAATLAKAPGPVDTSLAHHVHYQTLPFDGFALTGGFWAGHRAVNRNASLRHGYQMLQKAGNFHNLRMAAGLESGEYSSHLPFLDSDLYKWLEAVSYELGNGADTGLEKMASETIGLLEKAQGEDGYLNSYYTVVKPERRWLDLRDGHELYCAGHLFQAAVAHHRTTGQTRLLNIAMRCADYIGSVFGPGKLQGFGGHPEAETALIELYRDTGEKRYLNLAKYFLDERGHGLLGAGPARAAIYQDQVPVRDAKTVEGHVVRQLYLAAGVADLYMETGERALLDALLHQWHDMTSHKLYITGGVGSRLYGEAFGEAYELPGDIGYCETCAQIASIMWNWRLLLITGEAKYADLMERTLFNGFLSGRSLDGLRTRYENPLLRRGYSTVWGEHGNQREEWYGCACCPPNIMRLLSSLHHYMVTRDDAGIQLQQYAAGEITTEVKGEKVHLCVKTDYPWQGAVLLSVDQTPAAPWTLCLRVPSWCTAPVLRINSHKSPLAVDERGYVAIEREWTAHDVVELDLPMPPRLAEGHPRVDATRGSVGIERGPLVYCLESFDQPEGINLMDVGLEGAPHLEVQWHDDMLGGIMLVRAKGYEIDTSAWGDHLYRSVGGHPADTKRPETLVAIPCYAWDNRGLGQMRVWLPHG